MLSNCDDVLFIRFGPGVLDESKGESVRGLKRVGDIRNGTTLVLGISFDTSKLSLFSSSTEELLFPETNKFKGLLSSPESTSLWDDILDILPWLWLDNKIDKWNLDEIII